MIISRAPLRISLGGGGTDLPSYYSKHGGFVVSAAINKYVYVFVHRRFDRKIKASYTKLELVDSVDELQHPIMREGLRMMGISEGIEIFSMADIPANSGLGSSSAFTVALLNALHAHKRQGADMSGLAEEACKLEIGILGEPIGKQDQYISAFGGITSLDISNEGVVEAKPVPMTYAAAERLESNLTMFYTGIHRSASDVLSEQNEGNKKGAGGALESMHQIKEIGKGIYSAMCAGEVDDIGRMFARHWESKRRLSQKVSSGQIDAWYREGIAAGATGGKIIGAGGGGFLLFYCPERKEELRKRMEKNNLREVPFKFDSEGAKIVLNI